jgi:asparagine synthase (glutamine-hydrolysing)
MYQSGHDPAVGPKLDTRQARYDAIRPGKAMWGALFEEQGAAFGMDQRDPTNDKRLIEFCLSIPDEMYVGNGRDRLLVRRGMEGLMPPEILWSELRGIQAADIGQRLRKKRAETEKAFELIKKSKLAQKYLNMRMMADIISPLWENRVGVPAGRQVSMDFLRGLMVGLFLLRFERD